MSCTQFFIKYLCRPFDIANNFQLFCSIKFCIWIKYRHYNIVYRLPLDKTHNTVGSRILFFLSLPLMSFLPRRFFSMSFVIIVSLFLPLLLLQCCIVVYFYTYTHISRMDGRWTNTELFFLLNLLKMLKKTLFSIPTAFSLPLFALNT